MLAGYHELLQTCLYLFKASLSSREFHFPFPNISLAFSILRSFGWDSNESLTQHDAQELNRLLCDRLEEQMKGTPVEGAIEKLFVGEMESYVKCVNVQYESRRKEQFYDLQVTKNILNDIESDEVDGYIVDSRISGSRK